MEKSTAGAYKSLSDTALIDIKSLRTRARRHIENGAVTETYRADKAHVVKLLNEALATELVCFLRYRRHYFMAVGINAETVAPEFLEHSNQELQHVDLLAARIVQLNGEPDFDPDVLSARSHAEYVPGRDLIEMIKEDLIAERIAIESYGEMISYVGDKDSTTRRILESILAVEEEHADDMASFLTGLPPHPASPEKSSS